LFGVRKTLPRVTQAQQAASSQTEATNCKCALRCRRIASPGVWANRAQQRAFCRWTTFLQEDDMGIISWIILGLIAGFIGSKIVDKQGQGLWLNIALGIVGALVGGFLFDFFGAAGVTGFNIYSMIVAIVGSIVVLLIYNAVTGRRSRA
jgi:uncharacterized membrane protein YeaQ/YmgE (transglycosylase-associated protein family)